jgi:MFS family permease
MTAYRPLVQATGPAFLIVAFLARLPAAMGTLGVITLVAAATGSFAVAGATAAAYGIGAAAGGPVVGALADRFGQRRVVLAAAVIDAAAFAGIVAAVGRGATPVAVGLLTAIAGFATPQIGPLVRVRWAVLLGDRGEQRNIPAAFSYEGAADELSYMAGPAIVGLLAIGGPKGLPLGVAAALTIAAAIPFAMHHTAPPVVRAPRERSTADRLPRAAVAMLIAAMLAIGVLFGATQTRVTSYAERSGTPGAAGLIYAVLGVGSAVAGLATAWIPARISLRTRYVASTAAMAVGALTLALLSASLPGLLVAMALAGLTSAPYLISVGLLASSVSPPRRAGVVMTLVGSGVVAGVALGAAVAGRLADAVGPSGAFAVLVGGGVVALVLAVFSGRALRMVAPRSTAELVRADA